MEDECNGMDVQELQAELDTFCRDKGLMRVNNLVERERALAFVHYIQRIARTRRHQSEVLALQRQAAGLQQRLEAVNATLFQWVRAKIRMGCYTSQSLRQEFNHYTAYTPARPGEPHFGQEALDTLVQGVLECEPLPQPSQARSAEMIHFERTPVSVILEMTDRIPFAPQHQFYDLGSGLGQVVILVNLLTGVGTKGVEVEPAYHAYARRCVGELALSRVELINADAQRVDLRDGDIFFMFTPFTGGILQSVLTKLREVARWRPITLCTYGPCTPMVAQEPWLHPLDDHFTHEFKLAIFQSTDRIG